MRNGVEWLMNLAIDHINSNNPTDDNGFNMNLVEKVLKSIILLDISYIYRFKIVMIWHTKENIE